jgi:hypothetical protein
LCFLKSDSVRNTRDFTERIHGETAKETGKFETTVAALCL